MTARIKMVATRLLFPWWSARTPSLPHRLDHQASFVLIVVRSHNQTTLERGLLALQAPNLVAAPIQDVLTRGRRVKGCMTVDEQAAQSMRLIQNHINLEELDIVPAGGVVPKNAPRGRGIHSEEVF